MTENQHRPSTQKEKAKQKCYNQKRRKDFAILQKRENFVAPPFALELDVTAVKETANTLKIIQEANFFVFSFTAMGM